MDVKKRVYTFIESKGIPVKRFEELCGLSNGYISSMRKGFGKDKLNNVLKMFPELNRDWLIYGEGEMLKPTGNTVTVGTAQQSTVVGGNYYGMPTRTHEEEPPFIEAEEAGAPVIPMSILKTPNIDILQYVQSHRTGIECSGIRIDNMPIVLWHRVGDHALEPAYNKGDLLGLCDYPQGQEDPIPGKIYAVDTRNNGMIVRILFPDGEDFRAHATNPDFPDFIIRRENIIRIYRKMIMVRT